MSVLRIEGITFPVALRILLFKLCYTEKLQLLALFPMHFSSVLTKTVYSEGQQYIAKLFNPS